MTDGGEFGKGAEKREPGGAQTGGKHERKRKGLTC